MSPRATGGALSPTTLQVRATSIVRTSREGKGGDPALSDVESRDALAKGVSRTPTVLPEKLRATRSLAGGGARRCSAILESEHDEMSVGAEAELSALNSSGALIITMPVAPKASSPSAGNRVPTFTRGSSPHLSPVEKGAPPPRWTARKTSRYRHRIARRTDAAAGARDGRAPHDRRRDASKFSRTLDVATPLLLVVRGPRKPGNPRKATNSAVQWLLMTGCSTLKAMNRPD